MAARGASTADAIQLDEDEVTESDGSNKACDETERHGIKRRHADRVGAEKGVPDEEVEVKVEWTDSSDGAYGRLAKRKRSVTRRGSGRGRGGGRSKKTAAGSSRRSAERGGRRSSGRSGRTGRYLSNANDDSDSSGAATANEEGNDNVPDYIVQRRHEFEERQAVLKEAGLRLPPDYTDVYFSDDERAIRRVTGRTRGPLQKRPQFDSSVRPSRECKDVQLQYSGGVIPGCIAQYLRDYQIEGVQFLHRQFVYQRGGILGDDMGLGKTVQVAAFLTAAFGKTGDERDDKRMRKMRRAAGDEAGSNGRWYPVVLVVCPGSLIQNWRNELQRWGWWHVDVYHGAGKEDVLQAARAGRLEIMVTTYATYKNHRERINTVAWDAVVADECHVLKERDSGTTRAMNEVNALCRIGLTGTAIQNRYAELWTLLDWTNPGRFGSLAEWNQTISRPLTIGQSHDATLYQLSLARRTAKKLVQNLLPDVFLRRMKSLIADQLPRKTDRVVFCPLTERQAAAYERLVDSPDVTFLRTVSDPCDCDSGAKRGWCCYRTIPGPHGRPVNWASLVFPAIQSLQKLASHLMLLVPGTHANTDETADRAADRHERQMRLLQTCEPDGWASLYRHRDSMVHLADPELCGKWKVLRKLLRFWHDSGDKVLVFSHTVRLLQMLQHLFHSTSYSVSYLDGSLSYEERQRVVDDFNTDPAQFVFLISTRAGGVGLNITSANKVVIVDPHWNPAYDLQAQDRAYRIGQVRDVDVFRLVSAGTIEEIVYARQIYKQQQANIGYSASTERRYFRGVQQDSARKGEIFGLGNLLAFHGDQVVLRDIVNKTNIAEAKAGVQLTSIDMEQVVADEDIQVLVKLEGDGGSGGGDDKDSRSRQPKSDAVQAILASAGVEYTHDNAEVVGSSRVEAQLSRRAELVLGEEEEEIDENVEDEQDEDRSRAHDRRHADDLLLADTSAAFVSAGDDGTDGDPTRRGRHARFRLSYNPPADVMRRQFGSMAREAGFGTATEFALVVESWTPEQRRQWLEGFYRRREQLLGGTEEDKRAEEKEDAKWTIKEEKEDDKKTIVKEEKEDVKWTIKEEGEDTKMAIVKKEDAKWAIKEGDEPLIHCKTAPTKETPGLVIKPEPLLPKIKAEDDDTATNSLYNIISLVSSSPPAAADDDDDETDEL
ncbi:DNA excision repair protein [Grosmannia clavigera kw1407]|uniref:DNA excision repair protein n=1 Tax=Grosmannia clavigera (strain kw1407 / UAMH 11150) TaxID=655863 RepID=F0XLQ5_GROCL|nr:DNA excision repair protein [Grosmannia clavigera kw1407]EFX01297.1 DNA excision repair protein [Grosmannia clavigera kw1407]